MKYLYKLISILLLVPSILLATDQKGKHTKSKNIHKTFTISKQGSLNLTNKYGNINITTWDKNSIEIEVYIETNGNDEQKVIDRLKNITIDFDNSPSSVSAKTNIRKSGYSGWSLFSNNHCIGMKINYTVKMPVTNLLKVNNDYGNISIDKLLGKAIIHCDYGKLFIGELHHLDNDIRLNYNGKSTIEYLKGGTINSDYSTIEIEESETIRITADYSHIQIGTAKKLKYQCDYGDLKVDQVGIITGSSDYFHVKINELSDTANLNSEYGSVKIGTILSGFSLVKISSDYGNIKLGIEQNTSYNFNVKLEYGRLKLEQSDYTFHKKITKNSSKYYEGYCIKQNNRSNIHLQTSYGNVAITNN
ncbi:MAG: hypothetical protein COB98_07455 [Flavobacteriaceae bacterium]|nr:MAG: hypothetical protein COB98_07455 [Flavobacteriaceae bacterium]